MFPSPIPNTDILPERALDRGVSRRSVLKSAAALGLGIAAMPARTPSIARAAVGVPDVPRPTLTITVDAGSNVATVRVEGSIYFSEFTINQMQDGIEYALTCSIWEEDDPPGDSDDRCFQIEDNGDLVAIYYPDDRDDPDSSDSFWFSSRISAGVLNKDDNDWTRNFEDEIYALVEVWASDGGEFERIHSVRSNRIDRRF